MSPLTRQNYHQQPVSADEICAGDCGRHVAVLDHQVAFCLVNKGGTYSKFIKRYCLPCWSDWENEVLFQEACLIKAEIPIQIQDIADLQEKHIGKLVTIPIDEMVSKRLDLKFGPAGELAIVDEISKISPEDLEAAKAALSQGDNGKIRPLTAEDLAGILERAAAATPGPWIWRGNTKGKRLQLLAVLPGAPFIMGFEIKEEPTEYEGEKFTDRSIAMTLRDPAGPSEEGDRKLWESSAVMKDHTEFVEPDHNSEFCKINQADAQFIAHSRKDVEQLLSVLFAFKEAYQTTRNLIQESIEQLQGQEHDHAAGSRDALQSARDIRVWRC